MLLPRNQGFALFLPSVDGKNSNSMHVQGTSMMYVYMEDFRCIGESSGWDTANNSASVVSKIFH